jgi:hypothetical protein
VAVAVVVGKFNREQCFGDVHSFRGLVIKEVVRLAKTQYNFGVRIHNENRKRSGILFGLKAQLNPAQGIALG